MAPPTLVLLVLTATLGGAAAQWWMPPRAVSRNDERCRVPDGRVGACRIIYKCPEMFALLEGVVTQENIQLLNQIRCGYQGHAQVVCCPDSPLEPVPTPSRPFSPPPWSPPTPSRPFNPPSWSNPTPPRPAPTPPRPQPTPSQPGGGGGGGTGANAVPRDVSRHPNVGMLPQLFCGASGADRIVGGNVSDIYAHPWIARLGYKLSRRPNAPPSYRCGGTLVSQRYVLTAAHCVARSTLRVTTVKLGEHNVNTPIDCRESGACLPPPLDVGVEEVIIHPEYEAVTSYNDIALLRLARPVDFQREEFVRPVCLPVGSANQNQRLEGIAVLVAGWGTNDKGEDSPVLLNVFVPALSTETCQEAYSKRIKKQPRIIIPQQLCAGGEQGRDSCSGDSGGPLTHESNVNGEVKTVQYGVVSYGPQICGTPGLPGVYTRISFYMQWILDTIRP